MNPTDNETKADSLTTEVSPVWIQGQNRRSRQQLNQSCY